MGWRIEKGAFGMTEERRADAKAQKAANGRLLL